MAFDKVDYTNFFHALSNIKTNTDLSEDKLLSPLKLVLLDSQGRWNFNSMIFYHIPSTFLF
jgi:hypothetical protein